MLLWYDSPLFCCLSTAWDGGWYPHFHCFLFPSSKRGIRKNYLQNTRTVYVRIIIDVINVKIRHPKGFRFWWVGGGRGVDTFISIWYYYNYNKHYKYSASLHGISKKLLKIASHRKCDCRHLTSSGNPGLNRTKQSNRNTNKQTKRPTLKFAVLKTDKPVGL